MQKHFLAIRSLYRIGHMGLKKKKKKMHSASSCSYILIVYKPDLLDLYNHIIVPMALDHGIKDKTMEIARTLLAEGGKITALHVYEAPNNSVGAFVDNDVIENAFNNAKAKMDARAESMAGVEAMVVKGHSGRTIVDTAASLKADCIVIGSHKPGLIDYLLGSTAARVVRHAHCAVHVARD